MKSKRLRKLFRKLKVSKELDGIRVEKKKNRNHAIQKRNKRKNKLWKGTEVEPVVGRQRENITA